MTLDRTSSIGGTRAGSNMHSAKARVLSAFEREHATTLNVLAALPAGKSEFKPHERSNTALMLAWTFVIEEQLMLKALNGEPFGGGFPKPPDSWDKVLAAFKQGYRQLIERLRDSKNANLEGTVKFFTGPKQMGDIPLESFLWFMVHDQIHHRGQLSVYVRMTGGKVPSIYGPSADEPW